MKKENKQDFFIKANNFLTKKVYFIMIALIIALPKLIEIFRRMYE